MHIDGRCHCGYITFEAEIDPETVGICHCTDCQAFSGAPYRVTVPARRENFKLLSGRPKAYVKTAESGNKRVQAFCPECGTHIYAAAPGDSPVYGLRLGTIKQRAQLVPKRQIWHRSSLAWAQDIHAMPSIAKQPPL
jgi:hypothetical protein